MMFFSDNFIEQVEALTDDEAGTLLKGMVQYAKQGKVFRTDNRMVKFVFASFKVAYDCQLRQEQASRKKRAEAGRKGGLAKASNAKQCQAMLSNATENAENEAIAQNAQENVQNVAMLSNANESADAQQLTLFDNEETQIIPDKNKENNNINNNNINNNNRDSIRVIGEKEEEKEEEKKKKEKKKEEKEAELARRQANLEKRKQEFYQSLVPFCDLYPREMIRDFYDYWSELNRSKTQMRFEQEKTWETSKRLATWARRDKTKSTTIHNGSNRTNYQADAARQRAEDAADLVNRLLAENDA